MSGPFRVLTFNRSDDLGPLTKQERELLAVFRAIRNRDKMIEAVHVMARGEVANSVSLSLTVLRRDGFWVSSNKRGAYQILKGERFSSAAELQARAEDLYRHVFDGRWLRRIVSDPHCPREMPVLVPDDQQCRYRIDVLFIPDWMAAEWRDEEPTLPDLPSQPGA